MSESVSLSPYQEVSRDFLMGRTFACLWDSPGVGKTFPAIDAAWRIKGSKPILVTCPTYLQYNWRKEIHRLYPNATVELVDGSGAEARSKSLNSDADFIVTGYANWSAKDGKDFRYPELVNRPWSALICDEAHRFRGHKSTGAKHFYRLKLSTSPNKNTPLWMLTGTPMVRDGSDFYTYFRMFDPKNFGSFWRFVEERCVTTETPWAKQIGNIRKSYAREFQQEISQFSLRRTPEEIPELKDLDYVENEYTVETPPSVIKMIKKAKKDYVLEHPDMDTQFLEGSGALYVKQRQLATNPPTKAKPKIDWLKDFLDDHTGRLVVYVWYKDSARLVHEMVGSGQRLSYLATGDMSPGKRASVVDMWKEDPTGVLVATIPALKEGLSLVEANEVVFLEHSELPADQEQCIKRLCRRGQTKLVQVHHVHAEKTVDTVIKRVLENRNLGISEALAKWIQEEETDEWFT